jgi:hypothetical protein
MIQYSDNNATMLLNGIIDIKIFKKVFTDLGLSEPGWYAKSYPISANEYSVFLRVLFNSGYLNMKDSEFALRLLTKSDFKNGIVNGLPSSVQLAHKFGESGDASEKQLHESAIVYLNNNPFLITIMTKGKDLKKLPEVIKEASNLVYPTRSQTPNKLDSTVYFSLFKKRPRKAGVVWFLHLDIISDPWGVHYTVNEVIDKYCYYVTLQLGFKEEHRIEYMMRKIQRKMVETIFILSEQRR